MRFKRYLLKSVIIFLILSGIASIFFVFNTLNGIDINKLSLSEKDFSRAQVNKFESDSIVDTDQFKTFLNFSNNEYVDEKYLERLISEKKIENLGKNKLLIKENFEIEGIVKNNCKFIYCFQNSIPFYKIPKQFWLALIGIEDIRFLNHSGVDPKSIARAIVKDLRHMKFVEGGSTITQQLIKNIFLDSKKSIVRKIKEVITSFYIEYRLDKYQILQAYLNEVYWGSLNNIRIKGIFSASVFYFSKKPENLSSYEATILISMLKGPSYYHPIRGQERLKERVDVLFKKLNEKEIFNSNESTWNSDDWQKWKTKLEAKNKKMLLYSIWETQKSKGLLAEFERFVLISNVQQVISYAKKKTKEKNFGVKVFFSSITESNYFFYYSKYERDKEAAFKDEKHQVGSSIKPIAYSLLLDEGVEKETEVSTDPIELNLLSGNWSPSEAHSIKEKEISVIEALKKSYNRPLVRLSKEVGFDKMERGLDTYFPNIKKPLSEYPSQLLGAIELSIFDYSKSYIKFFLDQCKKETQKNIIFDLSNPNETTIKNVVDKYLKEMRFFGKTGTSNNGFDNWFVSFDGKWMGIVWFGYEGKRNEKDLRIFGSTTAYRIYQGFMRDRGKRFHEMTCDFVNI